MNNYRIKQLFLFLKYNFYRPHRKGHGIHSPFLFDFVTTVINNKANSPQTNHVLNLRRQLLKNASILEIEDLGAGSGKLQNPERKIKDIIRYSSSSVKYGRLLHNTMAYFQPNTILELGTSLGLGTAFMATANPTARIVTIEGSNPLLRQARKNFDSLKINNITAIQGNFNDVLPQVLKQYDGFDLIYIDGNHRKDATLRYFATCLPYMKSNGIIIFDDIRWSEEMYDAWQEITKNDRVTLSLDLFQLGMVFFNEKLKKQHFQIYY